jgi:DNA-binding MarR family transcriptional regulator
MALDYTSRAVSVHITDLQRKGLVVRMTEGEKRYVCLTK